MENYLDTLFDQSNELYLKYINNYISIKRLKKVIKNELPENHKCLHCG